MKQLNMKLHGVLFFGIQAILAGAPAALDVQAADSAWILKPEWNGPYERREVIDVNLGHRPEVFVRAAWAQIAGEEPDAEMVQTWTERLLQDTRLRRIDVIRALCEQAGRRNAPLAYSDPWQEHVVAPRPSGRKITTRDVGAVLMFFFNCPGGVNCGMDWANTHAPGMDTPSPLLAFGTNSAGYYDPSTNPGFWVRELTDAESAGLDFVLPNVYGPDLEEQRFKTLLQALETLNLSLKFGLFDDTWTWGEPWFSDFWREKPDLSDTEAAAQKLYSAKWRPYFLSLPAPLVYTVKGRPLIYFYNGGKLEPRHRAAAVLKRMKELFAAEFGTEPFLAVDAAFFEDPEMEAVADQKFIWYTFDLPERRSSFTRNGIRLDHAMVRWDSVGRDRPGAMPQENDLIIKGPELLEKVLRESSDADLLVFATWNDLGEGTGINRNYDYYYRGQWLPPDHFMSLIRQAQYGGVMP